MECCRRFWTEAMRSHETVRHMTAWARRSRIPQREEQEGVVGSRRTSVDRCRNAREAAAVRRSRSRVSTSADVVRGAWVFVR